jgi:hypothetical protein
VPSQALLQLIPGDQRKASLDAGQIDFGLGVGRCRKQRKQEKREKVKESVLHMRLFLRKPKYAIGPYYLFERSNE